jgi:hypothetical protein
MQRLQSLFDTLIRAMHAAHTQPSPATRAQEQEAHQAYTDGLREVIG